METTQLISLLISIATLVGVIILFVLALRTYSKGNISEFRNEIELKLSNFDKNLKDEFTRNREEYNRNAKTEREEVANSFKKLADQVFGRINDLSKMQKDQLEIFSKRLSELTKTNEEKFDRLNLRVESQLKELQEKNSQKLEEMRKTVDEKLHDTLEKRLGESFKVVSSQLKSVYEGLGEMQKLATGVGDLKRVLTNVKARGTWGEVQLEKLIEQVLVKEQYAKNVRTKKGSSALVEFAIKMPGSAEDEPVWIPVDAKFPLEDYQRLMDARDIVDLPQIEETTKAIERRIKQQAKDIQEKYLDPPNTTDFAVMFLPIEGLYAEVLRIPGLFDQVQKQFRVTMTGPTNFLAVLNSLQMGFRTLAIQKRSSEVWKLLGAVKTEFGKFGRVLEKTKKKLQEASNTIDDASTRTRVIERKLRDVEELPGGDQPKLLDEDY